MTAPNFTFRLRYALSGRAVLAEREPLRFVKNSEVVVDLIVEEEQSGAIPPSYAAVNVTGWTSKWVSKSALTDTDAQAKWNISGVVTDAVNGKIRFTIPKATMTFTAERIFGEFVLMPSALLPQTRVPHQVTVTEAGLTI